jgi:hypothetical protein
MKTKTIKIRFVKHKDIFMVQRKVWFGWTYIRYVLGGNGGQASFPYGHDTKKGLLELVLEGYYQADKRFLTIKEYPTIKIY